jgi:hypothetical protein
LVLSTVLKDAVNQIMARGPSMRLARKYCNSVSFMEKCIPTNGLEMSQSAMLQVFSIFNSLF